MDYKRRLVLRNGLALGAMAFVPYSFAKKSHPFHFLNWADYIAPSNITSFEDKTGEKVFQKIYASLEEMYVKLNTPNHGMHVACMTTVWASRLMAKGLLQPIDRNKIPNFSNISPEWQGLAFDGDNTYHVPYLWGTTGMGYNSAVTGDTDMSDMKWILNSDKFSGEIAWLDSAYTMVTTAMAYLGNGVLPSAYDPNLVKEAFALLNHQKKHVRVFAPDTGQEMLMAGDVSVALEYNGDICQINSEDNTMHYALPKNGATRWLDVLVMPRFGNQAEEHDHRDHAHQFINHMLDAKQGFDLVQQTGYLTPNRAVQGLLKNEPQLCSGDSFFPPADVIASLPYEHYYSLEYQQDVENRWISLKTQ